MSRATAAMSGHVRTVTPDPSPNRSGGMSKYVGHCVSIRSPAEITVKRAERGDRPSRIESVTAAEPNERRRTACDDSYVERGESENRHKKLKNDFTGTGSGPS